MARRRLSGFIRRPSLETVRRLAAAEHLDLDDAAAAELGDNVNTMLALLDRLDDLPQPETPLRYLERDPGGRPSEAEDPHNVFIRRCRVEGAPAGLLRGKRIGLKDNIKVAGVPMTNGSPLMPGYVPDVDATVVRRLLDAGASIVAKLNMDDFSFSGTGETSFFGCVLNPWNTDYSAGGSSSGAGAAVADGSVDIALGVDNGGSGRIPASWCGVVGLKATHGLIPTFGVTYLDHTTDFVCPLARSVAHVAATLEAIAGDDPDDAQFVRGPIPVERYSEMLDGSLAGRRLAVVREGFAGPFLEPDVEAAVRAALAALEAQGAVCREVSIPLWPEARAIWNGFVVHSLLAMVESGLEGFNRGGRCDAGWQYAFGTARRAGGANLFPPVMKTLLVTGRYLRDEYFGTYFSRATNLRTVLRRQVDAVLAEHDALVTPTTPMKAFRLLDHKVSMTEVVRQRAASMTLNTYPTNVTGHPSLSIPCGVGENRLPIGLQLVGPRFGEAALLRLGHLYERVRGPLPDA
ncbi:MAG: amidase family protein [Dongiaceae bacterium]